MSSDLTQPPVNPDATVLPPRLPSPARRFLAWFLTLFVLLFLADAVLSLADDSLLLFKQANTLSTFRFLIGTAMLLATIVVYVLMALTPLVPKRWFVPLALFGPVTSLAAIFFAIYHYNRFAMISWVFSGLQVMLGLWVLFQVRKQGRRSWPLLPAVALTGPGFTWRNLLTFVAANLFILVPALLFSLFLCIGLAVNHFTNGFMTLHPTGFVMQARTYTRPDGKTIELFPMAHVAESDFYRNVLQAFPTNATILMEGVTDEQNLLTNKISYKRMAKSLGLAEQHEQFVPHGKVLRADIDVDQFSTNTIALLNLVMMFHTQGMNPANTQALLSYSPSPELDRELMNDLLLKRNRHLLGEIEDQLPQSEYIVVPWGVAHMPWISEQIQKLGFHLQETREYSVIRFFHPSAKTTR